MAKKTKTEKLIKKLMTEVGTYNESFDLTISLLGRILEDYKSTIEQFEKSGGSVIIPHTNKAGAKNYIKNPLYHAIEQMRKDVIIYLRDLGLTPAGLKKINQSAFGETAVDSPLIEILNNLSKPK